MSHFLRNCDILPQSALHFRDLRLFVAKFMHFSRQFVCVFLAFTKIQTVWAGNQLNQLVTKSPDAALQKTNLKPLNHFPGVFPFFLVGIKSIVLFFFFQHCAPLSTSTIMSLVEVVDAWHPKILFHLQLVGQNICSSSVNM